MVVTDPRQPANPIVLANRAFLELTGYCAEQVIGRNCRFLQGVDTNREAIAEVRGAIHEQRELTIELLNYRQDGSAFWNRLHVSPIHGDDGDLLYFYGSQGDVTDLRKVAALQATERRLLKEVDHRARNVLAVVNGIVRLSRSDDAKLYASAIHQRVQALAAAHALLAEGGWREVPLVEIIRQHLEALGTDRVCVDGPHVMVSALVVQPLALVIHELFCNAVTHGALSSPTGTLSVRWEKVQQAGGFELRWAEMGGPLAPESRRPGFGTMMLRGMIEKQLRGRIVQHWTPTGLVVTIEIPGGPADLPEPAAA